MNTNYYAVMNMDREFVHLDTFDTTHADHSKVSVFKNTIDNTHFFTYSIYAM